jgi:hypothetical protein
MYKVFIYPAAPKEAYQISELGIRYDFCSIVPRRRLRIQMVTPILGNLGMMLSSVTLY